MAPSTRRCASERPTRIVDPAPASAATQVGRRTSISARRAAPSDPGAPIATTALAGSAYHRAGRAPATSPSLTHRRFGATASTRIARPPAFRTTGVAAEAPGLRPRQNEIEEYTTQADLKSDRRWSGRRESNPRHSAWEADVLPLNYGRIVQGLLHAASMPRGMMQPGSRPSLEDPFPYPFERRRSRRRLHFGLCALFAEFNLRV